MSTPVQRQYQALKAEQPDAILFFRLGDFYEMFHEDAQLASRILGIALTARHRGTENEMPMCGFPYHAHEEYLEKLVDAGYKVAIAEQVEDPETKAIHREITRVVTPGTSMENGNLDPDRASLLIGISKTKDRWALASSDVSTGDFRTAMFEDEISFLDELWKLDPREILIPSDVFEDESFCELLPKTHLTPRCVLDSRTSSALLKEHFNLQNLDVFGIEKVGLLLQVSALTLEYLQETQKTNLHHIRKITRYSTANLMMLDRQTMRHLEIFTPIYHDEEGATLLSIFRRPCTAIGAREVRMWMGNPLTDLEKILDRHAGVEELSRTYDLAASLETSLKNMSDLERLLGRLVTGRAGPRDLGFLRDSLQQFPHVSLALEKAEAPILQSRAEAFTGLEDLAQTLESSLVEVPPLEMSEGGIFRDGHASELDALRTLCQDSASWLDNFLEQKKEESGIDKLRIKYSKTFGYCLELSKGQINKVPEHWIRRQTLVNAERYTTPELAEFEEKALSAESQMKQLEYDMFQELREKTLAYTPQIQAAAGAIATIDALLCFTRTAEAHRWTRPQIVEGEGLLQIQNGRHPVVEALGTETFIANSIAMQKDQSRMHLITGPNMAGKSTFLRQNALIILLAQIGCFVPASEVKMSLFDRVFTRVGASDNVAAGKSTFFVEMTETASILNAATSKSFIILDEIGRGTSTFDGISLAWAITEHLHNETQALTLFATHYHELIDLADSLGYAANFHVAVGSDKDGIIFLHTIEKGGISDSFGIEVARIAGVPDSIITKAKDVLARLENGSIQTSQPTLFSSPRVQEKIVKIEQKSDVENFLEKLDPDELSPKKALENMFKMKEILKKSS